MYSFGGPQAGTTTAADYREMGMGIYTEGTGWWEDLGTATGVGAESSLGAGTAYRLGAANLAADDDILTQDEWNTEYKRGDMTYEQGISRGEAASKAEMHDSLEFRNLQTSDNISANLAGQLIGGSADPINWIPVIGWAGRVGSIIRMGNIARGVTLGVGEGLVHTAATWGITHEMRKQLGDDVSAEAFRNDMLVGGILGGMFGGIGGVYRVTKGRKQAHIDQIQDAQTITVDALKDLEAGFIGEPPSNERVAATERLNAKVETELKRAAARKEIIPDEAIDAHAAEYTRIDDVNVANAELELARVVDEGRPVEASAAKLREQVEGPDYEMGNVILKDTITRLGAAQDAIEKLQKKLDDNGYKTEKGAQKGRERLEAMRKGLDELETKLGEEYGNTLIGIADRKTVLDGLEQKATAHATRVDRAKKDLAFKKAAKATREAAVRQRLEGFNQAIESPDLGGFMSFNTDAKRSSQVDAPDNTAGRKQVDISEAEISRQLDEINKSMGDSGTNTDALKKSGMNMETGAHPGADVDRLHAFGEVEDLEIVSDMKLTQEASRHMDDETKAYFENEGQGAEREFRWLDKRKEALRKAFTCKDAA